MVKVEGAVKPGLDVVALSGDAQGVPLAQYRRGDGGRSDLVADTVLEGVKAVISLQSVGADNVVVGRILRAEDESAAGIDAAGDGFESDGEIESAEALFSAEDQRKVPIRRGLEELAALPDPCTLMGVPCRITTAEMVGDRFHAGSVELHGRGIGLWAVAAGCGEPEEECKRDEEVCFHGIFFMRFRTFPAPVLGWF